jgi:hypothetical protein
MCGCRSCLNLLRGWEKLLHQAVLVGLEGFVLLGFGGDQGVEAAQARGDALLFGCIGDEQFKPFEVIQLNLPGTNTCFIDREAGLES